PMIFTDETKLVEIADQNKEQIIKSILDEAVATNVKDGGIEGIYPTINEKAVGLRQFITQLQGNLLLAGPEVVDDNFLLGLYNQESRNLFFLLKMHSVPDIFDSMRAWEDKMFFDLHEL